MDTEGLNMNSYWMSKGSAITSETRRYHASAALQLGRSLDQMCTVTLQALISVSLHSEGARFLHELYSLADVTATCMKAVSMFHRCVQWSRAGFICSFICVFFFYFE